MPKKKATRGGAQEKGDACDDRTHAKKIESRREVRQSVWNEHFQNPAKALSEALRRVEEWEDAGSSTAGGSRR